MATKYAISTIFEAADKFTAPIGKMQKKIGSFTRGMERGLRRVNNSISRLTKKMGVGFKRGAIVLAAAVTGVSLAIKKVADRADALAKQARIIDMPIEMLQEYQFVAEQSGISSDSLTKSLGILDKQIGQAKTGTGTLVTMLKKSNPALLKQLTATKNTGQAFELMNKAIHDTKNPIDRAALAFAAYGRQGLAMVNMANLSTKELKKLREEARRNGIITEKQAEAAEAFNDQLNSLKHTMQGVLQDAILPLMEPLKIYLKNIQDWILLNKKLIGQRVKDFILGVGKAIKFLIDHGKTIAIVAAGLLGLLVVLRTFIVVMTAVNLVLSMNPLGAVAIAVAALTVGVIALVGWWRKMSDEVDKTSAKMTKTQRAAAKALPIAAMLNPFLGWGVNFGGNGTAAAAGAAQPQPIAPSTRMAAAITEHRSFKSAEVTIRDETNRAVLTGGTLGDGVKLKKSGEF